MDQTKDRSFISSEDAISDLIRLMERLRDKETGCPWDLEQTFESIVPYTIEEAYEVAEAVNRNDMQELRDELGDLFLQVVFQSQIAKDQGEFDIQDVARSIVNKMVHRHPHVFGSVEIENSEAQTSHWEELKAKERENKSDDKTPVSALDGVAYALPSLTRAEKLLKRAARVGFDWPSAKEVTDKLQEELRELEEAATQNDQAHVEEEMGDILLVVANLARKHNVDPESALRAANAKFVSRFQAMEERAREIGSDFSQLSLSAQSDLWQQVKATETK
ncbi:nucleoside triphosphate pyrophosphohydrolase [Hirschia baltica]|uniref:Nucleoside triphosphate pyrophosphohydrolase n=1 Tax=Hirschia baltica (strain ATCC 49814 / DSM 5838 / IFAM 1418) TaxID=582402 RepID=C6XJP8_HIRBI|nr:nucleoside triphosphate pyrophosphohydrolase [Hirschia baltica]ACT59343.1 MazG family protein [Hirschia baltica ATCC 49814]